MHKKSILVIGLLVSFLTIIAFAEENSSTTYRNDEYGVSINGPKGWHMERLSLIKPSKKDEEKCPWKRHDLVKFYRNYDKLPYITFQLFETHTMECYKGLEELAEDRINKCNAILLEPPKSIVVNGKKCIMYFAKFEKTGELRYIQVFFESKRKNSLVVCQFIAAIHPEDVETTRPLVEETINSVILK